ncbi:MAG: hypothetical protein JWM94_2569 [Sphingomonas bacterium]|nr:hypothetical protein [Sphingomonas bacterium]
MTAFVGIIMTGPIEAAPLNFAMAPIVMGVISLTVIVLLAAAVARRLHDSGRSGWWGIPAPLFLMSGMAMMARMFTAIQADTQTPGATDAMSGMPPLFGPILLNNLAYLASLLMLVILCCMASQPGDNRYGPSANGGDSR